MGVRVSSELCDLLLELEHPVVKVVVIMGLRVGSQSGFGVLLWTGRTKSRGCGVCWSVEGADWRGVEVWSLEERFRDEQPQPAAEGPQDAYRAHLIP